MSPIGSPNRPSPSRATFEMRLLASLLPRTNDERGGMIPITAIRKPQASFFRRRQFRSLEESDESKDESSGDSSLGESSSSEEERSAPALVSTAPAVAVRRGVKNERNDGDLAGGYVPPRRGIDIKLSLAIIRSRQLLDTASFAELSVSLKSLAACLPTSSLVSCTTLGVFAPILYRLVGDLRKQVRKERSREMREGMGSRDATALVGLAQRWDGGKGKGKGGELEWVRVVTRQVQSVRIFRSSLCSFAEFTRRSISLAAWKETVRRRRGY